jgi:hypothetical protein
MVFILHSILSLRHGRAFFPKGPNFEALLQRFGGGSGGDNYICNDGMGATVTGNRHHYQRIRI